jgi:sulfide:quinone oxidoreductase
MKKIVVLGAGTGGALIANILSIKLPKKEWQITVIEKAREHNYQPGYLFLPFRLYGYETAKDVSRPAKKQLRPGVTFVTKRRRR